MALSKEKTSSPSKPSSELSSSDGVTVHFIEVFITKGIPLKGGLPDTIRESLEEVKTIITSDGFARCTSRLGDLELNLEEVPHLEKPDEDVDLDAVAVAEGLLPSLTGGAL